MIFLVGVLSGVCLFLAWRWWTNYCKYRAALWLLRRKFQSDDDFDQFCERVRLELKLGYPLPDRKDDSAN